MTVSTQMCLIFRLDGIGFAFPAGLVEEVFSDREKLGDLGDQELIYRGVRIPRLDLGGQFGLPAMVAGPEGTVVVVKGPETPLAIMVDRIEGVYSRDQLDFHPVPPLLELGRPLPYRALALWRDQPLVYCDQNCLAVLAETM